MPPLVRLNASWVIPIEGPPIANGAVLVGTDGRIAAVGPDATVPSSADMAIESFPAAALLPGLVNAHTHLELTGLESPGDPVDFPRWIRRIRELKEQRSVDEYRRAARDGVQACWKAGVTAVADTGDSGAVLEALADLGGRGVVYQEVFGPHPDQVGQSLAILQRNLARLSQLSSDRVRLGVSPHAPYTVSGPLYRAVAELADQNDYPIAAHLAESRAESELIATSSGPFAQAWQARAIPFPDDIRHLDRPLPVRTPVRWLEAHGVLGPETLGIHAVQVDPGDIAILARNDVAIAHCPRSNAAHGHGEAPLAELLAAGLRVGLGTDSPASVEPDLLAEARAARALGGLSAERALRLITLESGLAIGLTDLGLISPGAWADLTVLRVASDPTEDSVVETILAAAPSDVLVTWIAGNLVYRA